MNAGAGVLRRADRHPLQRNLLMIAAHLVWGGTLALTVRELELARREVFATEVAPDRPQPTHPRRAGAFPPVGGGAAARGCC